MATTTYNNVKKIKIGDNIFNLYDSGGTVTSVDITNSGGISVSGSPITTSGNISVGLLAATDSVLGGIKTGFSTSEANRNYAVALDANSNKAYVNVPWTDTQVSSAANHYAPQTATGSDKTASASGATATWGIDVVKGITIKTDGKGHITDLSVTSGKIPANPNTDIKVQQNHSTANTNYPILISGTSSSTSARTGTVLFNQNAYINPSKGAIYAKMVKADEGVFNKLIAMDANFTNATVVGLLDIKGELHTNSWTNSSIANVGGSFYISPTVMTEYEEESNNSMTVEVSGSAGNRTIRVTDGSFANNTVKIYDLENEQTEIKGWIVGSRIMMTGNLRAGNTDYPLGTCIGKLTAELSPAYSPGPPEVKTATSFTLGGVNSTALENILTTTGVSSFTSKKIQISMYEIGITNDNAKTKPVGMMMQSYGIEKSTYMDIYGGVNIRSSSSTSVEPNVRIGYLGDLPSFSAGGVSHQPVGWGIYTDNGYFKGVIVADSGAIGGWKLNTNAFTADRNVEGGVEQPNFIVLSDGKSGISKEIMGQARTDWSFAIGNNIGITDSGDLYASNAYLAQGTLGPLNLTESGIVSTSSNSTKIFIGVDQVLFGYYENITFNSDGSGLIGRTVTGGGDYLQYSLENNGSSGTITLQVTSLGAQGGTFSDLTATNLVANNIILGEQDLATRLTGLASGISAVQQDVNALSTTLTGNYYTKSQIDTKESNINNTIDQNIGTVNQNISQINATLAAMEDSFGVTTEFYFKKDSDKKWQMRLGKEVSGKPNLNDIWIGQEEE